jgi:hypothetical protein
MDRSFKVWKAQVAAYLVNLKPSDGEMERVRAYLVNRCDVLRSRWITSFLADLCRFSDRFNLTYPEGLIPSNGEIEEWLSEKVEA